MHGRKNGRELFQAAIGSHGDRHGGSDDDDADSTDDRGFGLQGPTRRRRLARSDSLQRVGAAAGAGEPGKGPRHAHPRPRLSVIVPDDSAPQPPPFALSVPASEVVFALPTIGRQSVSAPPRYPTAP
jgi:hypothetical protein